MITCANCGTQLPHINAACPQCLPGFYTKTAYATPPAPTAFSHTSIDDTGIKTEFVAAKPTAPAQGEDWLATPLEAQTPEEIALWGLANGWAAISREQHDKLARSHAALVQEVGELTINIREVYANNTLHFDRAEAAERREGELREVVEWLNAMAHSGQWLAIIDIARNRIRKALGATP